MSRSKSYVFWYKTHFVRASKYWHRKSVFFLQEVLMKVDDAMDINILSGLPGIRNMGLAKEPDVQVTPFSPTYLLHPLGSFSANFGIATVISPILVAYRTKRYGYGL